MLEYLTIITITIKLETSPRMQWLLTNQANSYPAGAPTVES